MSNVQQLITSEMTSREPPKKIKRPCDFGLWTAVNGCETQVGTVETYNKLCDWADSLKAKIDAGNGVQALEMFSTDPKMIYPVTNTTKRK